MIINMEKFCCLIFTIVFVAITIGEKCKPKGAALYNVAFYGTWSIEDFPKQYPKFRPPAQWTKLIGRTHSEVYKLFEVGTLSSNGLKQFIETGASSILDHEVQGQKGIFDTFNTPPIASGVGETSSFFMADEQHRKVSMVSRIVPSPDWFVGVDSVDLCKSNDWINETLVLLDPLDGGTDQGYTFTAPNWPEFPPKNISKITAAFPNHPSSSFHYKRKDVLPKIGKIHIQLLMRYDLKGEYPKHTLNSENDIGYESMQEAMRKTSDDTKDRIIKGTKTQIGERRMSNNKEIIAGPSAINKGDVESTELRKAFSSYEPGIHQPPPFARGNDAEDRQILMKLDPGLSQWTSLTSAHSQNNREKQTYSSSEPGISQSPQIFGSDFIEARQTLANIKPKPFTFNLQRLSGPSEINERHNSKRRLRSKNIGPTDFPTTTKSPRRRSRYHHRRRLNRRRGNGKETVLNCLVSEWNPWSECSKSCGFGTMTRSRTITQAPNQNGFPCPPLTEQKLCGSMSTCNWRHFDTRKILNRDRT